MSAVEVAQTKNKIFITCIEQETNASQMVQIFKKQADYLCEHTNLTKIESKKLTGYAKLVKLLEFKHGRLIINEHK